MMNTLVPSSNVDGILHGEAAEGEEPMKKVWETLAVREQAEGARQGGAERQGVHEHSERQRGVM